MSVVVTHSSGFFSCCSLRLWHIIQYMNKNQALPTKVDSSQQFTVYKKRNDARDITFDYFVHYDIMPPIPVSSMSYHWDDQFEPYSPLPYHVLCPVVQKYFTPNDAIMKLAHDMEIKYNIHYSNTCVLFYRGNDKNTETFICNYDEYVKRARDILAIEPTIRFFIQSDETEFIEMFSKLFPNSFILHDEIRHIPKCNSTVDFQDMSLNYDYSKKYLAITLLMSRCKYVVCGSGNCSIWIMFYRGHANNVCQQLKDTWLMNINTTNLPMV